MQPSPGNKRQLQVPFLNPEINSEDDEIRDERRAKRQRPEATAGRTVASQIEFLRQHSFHVTHA